jgi:hypothetical protein
MRVESIGPTTSIAYSRKFEIELRPPAAFARYRVQPRTIVRAVETISVQTSETPCRWKDDRAFLLGHGCRRHRPDGDAV